MADAASLCAKRQALQEERAAVEAQLRQEEEAQRAKQPPGEPAPACAGTGALTCAGPSPPCMLEHSTSPGAVGRIQRSTAQRSMAQHSAGSSCSGQPPAPAPAHPHAPPATRAPASCGAAGAGDRGVQEDSLDAFMAGVVEVALESEGAAALRRQLAELDAGLERTERLLLIADPDG